MVLTFIALGLLLLYGLTYLLVESELLERPRTYFVSAAELAESDEERHLSQVQPGKLRIFIGKLLSCEFCTSGWMAIPAASCTVGLALALHFNLYWLVALLAVLIAPPTAVGFTVLIDRMSPKRASDRIVDAAIDIAAAIQENVLTQEKKK